MQIVSFFIFGRSNDSYQELNFINNCDNLYDFAIIFIYYA